MRCAYLAQDRADISEGRRNAETKKRSHDAVETCGKVLKKVCQGKHNSAPHVAEKAKEHQVDTEAETEVEEQKVAELNKRFLEERQQKVNEV